MFEEKRFGCQIRKERVVNRRKRSCGALRLYFGASLNAESLVQRELGSCSGLKL